MNIYCTFYTIIKVCLADLAEIDQYLNGTDLR